MYTAEDTDMTAQTVFRRLRPTTLAAIIADLYDSINEHGDPLDDHLANIARSEIVSNVGGAKAQRMIVEAMDALTGTPSQTAEETHA